MKKLCSWAFGTAVAASTNAGANTEADTKHFDNGTTHGAQSSAEDIPELKVTSVDPKVAEFFKHFPEPYRQKAIDRFSSRDGFYRWDFFRDADMLKEKQNAMMGIFLEDQRETEELKRQVEERERCDDRTKAREQFHDRHIPVWEQTLLKVIPLQPGDDMKLKLLQTSSLVVCGVSGFMVGVTNYKNSKLPKSRRQMSVVLSVGILLSSNIIAAHRLMDWGLFDRSVDDRDFQEKFVESFKDYYWKDTSSPP